MSSLFDKARVAVLGKMNELLDKVANTPEAYKQRIRDLESALADLRAANDEAVGTANGYGRQITEKRTQTGELQEGIDLVLSNLDTSDDSAAEPLQMELDGVNDEIEELEQLKVDANEQVTVLNTAVSKLEAKHGEMVRGLRKLTLTAAATKAQNRASSAAEAAVQATSEVDSVDSIQQKLDHDRDVSDARFSRVIGQLNSSDSPEEAVRRARARQALAARQAELKAQVATPAAPSNA